MPLQRARTPPQVEPTQKERSVQRRGAVQHYPTAGRPVAPSPSTGGVDDGRGRVTSTTASPVGSRSGVKAGVYQLAGTGGPTRGNRLSPLPAQLTASPVPQGERQAPKGKLRRGMPSRAGGVLEPVNNSLPPSMRVEASPLVECNDDLRSRRYSAPNVGMFQARPRRRRSVRVRVDLLHTISTRTLVCITSSTTGLRDAP